MMAHRNLLLRRGLPVAALGEGTAKQWKRCGTAGAHAPQERTTARITMSFWKNILDILHQEKTTEKGEGQPSSFAPSGEDAPQAEKPEEAQRAWTL
jgi:hypothetical protein